MTLKRIISIGDIHGDLAALLTCLRISGCINDKYKWSCTDTVVVFCGDLIDRYRPGITYLDQYGRGPGEIDREEETIVRFLNQLDIQASRKNSRVQKLVGNHELMRFGGDERYVTPYARNNGVKLRWVGPDAPMIKQLLKRDTKVVCTYHGWTFSHASILPRIVKEIRECDGDNNNCVYDFNDRANRLVIGYMKGNVERDTPALQRLLGDSGIVWDRTFNDDHNHNMCSQVDDSIKSLGCSRLVMAHCPQYSGEYADPNGHRRLILQHPENITEQNEMRIVYGSSKKRLKTCKGCTGEQDVAISTSCDRKIWRIDSAMSRAFQSKEKTSGLPQVLEVVIDEKREWVRVIVSTLDFWERMQMRTMKFGALMR